MRETGTQNPDLPHEFASCAHADCRWGEYGQETTHCEVCGLEPGAEVHRRRPERSLRESAGEAIAERERGS